MKTYQIILVDKFNVNNVEFTELHKTNDLTTLKNRLLKLQRGYCEDEKPTFCKKVFTSNELKLNCYVSECNADYFYMSVINVIK